LTLCIELSSFPFIFCFKLKGFAPSLSTKIPAFFCLDFRIKIECEEMCVYTFQLEPVFVFISLKLVKDYIFLIENNFTMIQKNEKAENLKNAKYHSVSIFILLTCVVIIILAQVSFKGDTVKNHILE